jgi:hypothetical protein
MSSKTLQQKQDLQGASKRASQLQKLIYIYLEDMYSVLNCYNVAKYTECYLG